MGIPIFWLLHFLCLLIVGTLFLILLIIGIRNRSKRSGTIILWTLASGVVLLFILILLGLLNKKMILDPDDYHGSYIVDRAYFKGKQTDWQYNHYRFEITENDSILFYETDGERIVNTYKGKVSYPAPYKSARLHIYGMSPSHQVLVSDPTIYRDSWDFNLVFKSRDFYNMYFIKGDWEAMEHWEMNN